MPLEWHCASLKRIASTGLPWIEVHGSQAIDKSPAHCWPEYDRPESPAPTLADTARQEGG